VHHGAPELRGAERGRYYGSENASVGMDGNSKTAEIAKTFAAIPTALMRIDAACREASLTIAEVCTAQCSERFFCKTFCFKTDDLPRQARDRWKNIERKRRFSL
jgi:hypothetical protein